MFESTYFKPRRANLANLRSCSGKTNAIGSRAQSCKRLWHHRSGPGSTILLPYTPGVGSQAGRGFASSDGRRMGLEEEGKVASGVMCEERGTVETCAASSSSDSAFDRETSDSQRASRSRISWCACSAAFCNVCTSSSLAVNSCLTSLSAASSWVTGGAGGG